MYTFIYNKLGRPMEAFFTPETTTSQYQKNFRVPLGKNRDQREFNKFDHFSLGEIPKKHMCPNETLRLECRELKSSNEYIKWKVWDSNSLKFIEIAYCNNSQKCTLLSHSQEFDGIIVKGVSKESLIIKRSTREARKRNVIFTCEVNYGSRTTNNPVVIDLSTKCKSFFISLRALEQLIRSGNILSSGSILVMPAE